MYLVRNASSRTHLAASLLERKSGDDRWLARPECGTGLSAWSQVTRLEHNAGPPLDAITCARCRQRALWLARLLRWLTQDPGSRSERPR